MHTIKIIACKILIPLINSKMINGILVTNVPSGLLLHGEQGYSIFVSFLYHKELMSLWAFVHVGVKIE